MAHFSFDHPSIDWDSADLYQEFGRFKSHVKFVFDGPLSDLKIKQQAGWLGTWIGQQGRETYKTFLWEEGEQEDPSKVLDKFEAYIRPRKNKRIARHRLKQRKQNGEESFDNFVKDLRLILMDCEYHDSDDILIDAMISGIREKKVQERLLDRGEDLTLAKALEIGQQFELSKQQIKIVRDEDAAKVSALQSRFKRQHKSKNGPKAGANKHDNPKSGSGGAAKTNGATCEHCGKDSEHKWSKGKCPALGSTCSYCKKPNHWVSVCRKRKKVNTVSVEPESESDCEQQEILRIHVTQDNVSASDDKWSETLHLLDRLVKFRIDAGARCNVLTLNTYQKLPHKGELRRSNKVLRTYSNHKISPVAVVDLPLRYKTKTLQADFELVDLEQESVLSGSTAEALGLITRLNTVKLATDTIPKELEKFPDLVRTTGTLPGTYTIKLEPGAKGVVHPARRQPSALKQKIVDKLG